jgi:hypothetical protein
MRRGCFVDRGRTLRGHRPRLSGRVLVSLGRLPPEIAFGLGLDGRGVGGRRLVLGRDWRRVDWLARRFVRRLVRRFVWRVVPRRPAIPRRRSARERSRWTHGVLVEDRRTRAGWRPGPALEARWLASPVVGRSRRCGEANALTPVAAMTGCAGAAPVPGHEDHVRPDTLVVRLDINAARGARLPQSRVPDPIGPTPSPIAPHPGVAWPGRAGLLFVEGVRRLGGGHDRLGVADGYFGCHADGYVHLCHCDTRASAGDHTCKRDGDQTSPRGSPPGDALEDHAACSSNELTRLRLPAKRQRRGRGHRGQSARAHQCASEFAGARPSAIFAPSATSRTNCCLNSRPYAKGRRASSAQRPPRVRGALPPRARHQGLGNLIPFPAPGTAVGRICRREWLGGLLNFYERTAA